MAFSSSPSSDSTSLERGVKIAGVRIIGGEVAFLFLLFFFSAAFTAETVVAVDEADYFTTTDLVLHWDFAASPACGPIPASPPTSTSVSSSASIDESDS
jgi:hypothetical protein